MFTRNLSIELKRKHRGIICVALHPGTVDTDLSRPFQRGVPPEKTSLIPNGVDAAMFVSAGVDARGAEARRLRNQLGLSNEFVVTYAGAVGLANDLGLLLDAAERTRNDPGFRSADIL